jgi:hypothetical protein
LRGFHNAVTGEQGFANTLARQHPVKVIAVNAQRGGIGDNSPKPPAVLCCGAHHFKATYIPLAHGSQYIVFLGVRLLELFRACFERKNE